MMLDGVLLSLVPVLSQVRSQFDLRQQEIGERLILKTSSHFLGKRVLGFTSWKDFGQEVIMINGY